MKRIDMTLFGYFACCFLILFLSITTEAQEREQPAGIRGRVTTLSGYPLEAIAVRLYQLELDKGRVVSSEGRLIQPAITTDLGDYQLKNLPWGQYRIVVAEPGFAEVELWPIFLTRGEDRVLDIALRGETHGLEAFYVTGKVQGLNPTPLEDVTITLVNAFSLRDVRQFRTDKNGLFRIPMIQPGEYILSAARPGFAVSARAFRTGEEKNIDFTLKPLRPSVVR